MPGLLAGRRLEAAANPNPAPVPVPVPVPGEGGLLGGAGDHRRVFQAAVLGGGSLRGLEQRLLPRRARSGSAEPLLAAALAAGRERGTDGQGRAGAGTRSGTDGVLPASGAETAGPLLRPRVRSTRCLFLCLCPSVRGPWTGRGLAVDRAARPEGAAGGKQGKSPDPAGRAAAGPASASAGGRLRRLSAG